MGKVPCKSCDTTSSPCDRNFIWPFDAIPDMLPGGYMDDLGILLAAIRSISNSIKESHKEKANRKCDKIFGSSNSGESDTVAA